MNKRHNVLLWVFATVLPKVFIFLVTLPLIILIRVMRPFIWIRFIPVSERIGHGIGNIEVYLLERRAGLRPSKAVDIFYPDRPWKCNRQVIKMWQRILPLYDFVYWIVWANWGNPLLAAHCYNPPNNDRDIHGLSNDTPPMASFTKKEDDRGTKLLRDMGIPPGSSIVCFHARDNAYLNELKPQNNWSYHDHRDANIDNYTLAIKELVARGDYVIRMGSVVNKAFAWKHPQVIDYAMSPWRCDFADMYLISRCHFYIGNNSGLEWGGMFFRKQLVFVNRIPMKNVCAWSPDFLNIFKKLWLIREKRFLTFREMLDCFPEGEGDYQKAGIEVIENTPEEILDVVVEKEERMKGCWQTNDEYEELQHRFWELFTPDELHQVFKARVGSKFLLQNKDLLN